MALGFHMGGGFGEAPVTIVPAGYAYPYQNSQGGIFFTVSEGEYDNRANDYTETSVVVSGRAWTDSSTWYIHDIAHFVGGDSNTFHLYIDKDCYVGNAEGDVSTLYTAGSTINVPARTGTAGQYWYVKQAI